MTEIFSLDSRLRQDTSQIADTRLYYLGLHKNALVPWLILVPKTKQHELFDCCPNLKSSIQDVIDQLALFSRQYFNAHKINIASLGNVVPQLHIHIIARKNNDFAWPDPVWGRPEFLAYKPAEEQKIIQDILQFLIRKNFR